ncbi:hypothetical protein DA482_25745 [Pseudomonas fluorescens]|jgi:hypothetical protein|nr:hypothetical protein BFW91_08055 [Pseudomonas fluorescens]PQA95452.1 hypothetical protein B0A76_26375 [Pseudomonas fluorescens]RFP97663.1 hypothetical protein D0N73_02620 [Pseudomonas fluorescens]TWR43523.1 hypothetical protein FIP59_28285 [Pseudomonas fluorescens]
MARAINKNKKPAINNKKRARNYFWGSFGSPCSFCDLAPANPSFKLLAQALQLVPTPSLD